MQEVSKFCYGLGLYMSPSDIELKMGTATNYYNKIVVAQQELGLRVNNKVNIEVIPPPVHNDFEGTKTKPSPIKNQETK